MPEGMTRAVIWPINRKHAEKRRSRILKWLRRAHGWIGLWGALLGLFFGLTGILLNHRAVMNIPVLKMTETRIQMSLPEPRPVTAAAMADWLQHRFSVGMQRPNIKVDAAQMVAWNGQSVQQPAHWQIQMQAPNRAIKADYWVGNRFVTLSRSESNLFSTLTRLHMSQGASTGWILLADSLAGSIILLALSGILLWTKLHGPRLLAAGLALASLFLAAGFALNSMA